MTDYAKAIEDGFEAARKAATARTEIDGILDDLAKQVCEATNGTVAIDKREYEVSSGLLLNLPAVLTGRPKEKYWALAARNPKVSGNKPVQLARWEMDRAGYPCKVTWGKQEHICEDGSALSACLEDLLRDPVIGDRLYALTKLEEKEGP